MINYEFIDPDKPATQEDIEQMSSRITGFVATLKTGFETVRPDLKKALEKDLMRLRYRQGSHCSCGRAPAWRKFYAIQPIPVKVGEMEPGGHIYRTVAALADHVRAAIGPSGEILAYDVELIWSSPMGDKIMEKSASEAASFDDAPPGLNIMFKVYARAV